MIVLTMCDLGVVFFLVSIMTNTSEASPNGSPEDLVVPTVNIENRDEDLEQMDVLDTTLIITPSFCSPEKNVVNFESPSLAATDISVQQATPQTTTASSSSWSTNAETVDLKCKHLYKVLTHMKVTAVELKNMTICDWKELIDMIYNYDVNTAITVLYEKDASSIGSLWDFYLYKMWIKRNNLRRSTDILEKSILRKAHGNIIRSLGNDLRTTECHPNNQYDEWIRKQRGNPTPHDVEHMVKKNQGKNKKQLIRNKLTPFSDHEDMARPYLDDALKPFSVFLNDLGNKPTEIIRLGDFGFTGTNWTGTRLLLDSAWIDIWDCYRFQMNVEHYNTVKSFFTLHNDFFNTVMFMLSSVHLRYMDQIPDDNHNKPEYAKQLYTLLDEYKQMMVIQDDSNVNYLLNVIDKIADKNADINITEEVSKLQANVQSLCSLLECSAILNTLQLKNHDNTIETLNKVTDLSNETGLLKDVKDFLDVLREIFKGMNLNVARSFFSHINTMSSAQVELFK